MSASPVTNRLERVLPESPRDRTRRYTAVNSKGIASQLFQESIVTVDGVKNLITTLTTDRQLRSVTLSKHQAIRKWAPAATQDVSISEKEVKELITSLTGYTSLVELDLSHNFNNALAVSSFAQAVKLLFLQTLNLSNNPLGCEGTGHLADALESKNIALKTLILQNTQMMHEGVGRIGGALKKNTSLQILDLQDNLCLESMDTSGTKKLAESLEVNSTLTSLNLKNCGLDSGTAYLIFKSLGTNSSLTNLDLSQNSIKMGFTYVNLSTIESQLTLNSIVVPSSAQTLPSNRSLTSLNLSDNLLTDKDVSGLVDALKGNSALRSLDLSGNKFSPQVERLFLEVFTENQSLTTFNLDGVNEVVEGLCKVNAIMQKDEFSILYDNLAKNSKGRGSESTGL